MWQWLSERMVYFGSRQNQQLWKSECHHPSPARRRLVERSQVQCNGKSPLSQGRPYQDQSAPGEKRLVHLLKEWADIKTILSKNAKQEELVTFLIYQNVTNMKKSEPGATETNEKAYSFWWTNRPQLKNINVETWLVCWFIYFILIFKWKMNSPNKFRVCRCLITVMGIYFWHCFLARGGVFLCLCACPCAEGHYGCSTCVATR